MTHDEIERSGVGMLRFYSFELGEEFSMPRELTSHKVNGLNDDLQILVHDEPGAGNGNHAYSIGYCLNPGTAEGGTSHMLAVKFQEGPVKEAGINGISNEALLAIVEDRLKGFQSGPYACRENALALTHLQESMHWLHHRTRERVARGVEGTMAK